jgi:hypothetical protein
MTGTWRAEDIPAYQFDGSKRRPMTDEHAAMSAPSVITRNVSEREARDDLLLHLARNAGYATRYNGQGTYADAMVAIARGSAMVRVGGRGYRIRDIAACEKEHGPYQNCPACLPADYPKFGRIYTGTEN